MGHVHGSKTDQQGSLVSLGPSLSLEAGPGKVAPIPTGAGRTLVAAGLRSIEFADGYKQLGLTCCVSVFFTASACCLLGTPRRGGGDQ